MATLVLVNGPPGVGKSTAARRYVDEHALTLLLEIDGLRASLGRWEDREESKVLARSLALALAETHLRAGYDVIVPQYLGRIDFILELADVAERSGATFRELVLLDDEPLVVGRFRSRRSQMVAGAAAHPQADIDDGSIDEAIHAAVLRLEAVAAERPQTIVIRTTDRPDQTYEAISRAVGG